MNKPSKLFILLCIIYIIVIITIIIIIKFSPGNRNYWRRAFGHLAKCPFGKTSIDIISTDCDPKPIRGTPPGVPPIGIVSYSLYGNYGKYHKNLLKSLRAIPKLMKGWQPYVYVGVDIPLHIKNKLLQKGAKVITVGPNPPDGHEAALWRFLPAMQELPFVSLDADDVFDKRIAKEICRWINSDKQFASFKRYPFFLKIAAGLWGSRNAAIPNMDKLIESYCEHWFGYDEAFLRVNVEPLFRCKGYYQSKTWLLEEAAIAGITIFLILIIITLILAYRR